MFANYLIGLREGLEASLVISILIAYVVRIGERRLLPRLWAGIVLAIVLSLGVGAFLQLTSQTLTFEAQEAFGGAMSIIAAGLITWMIFWMAKNARGIRAHLEGRVDQALLGGAWTLTIVAFMSVGREGLETALFLWAGIQASGSTAAPIVGALLGLATAVAVGFVVYKGAVRVNIAKLFTWTGALLIIVAAGVLAYGVHDLQEAGILPGLHNLAFDVSATIPPTSWYGTLLKGVFNFSPATTWLEFVVWWAYVVPTMALYIRMIRRRPKPKIQEKTVEAQSA